MDNNKIIQDLFIQLKKEDASKEILIGVTVMLLMNKSIFLKNSYVSDFIKSVFNISMPNYAVKSRTLMIAKICKIIFFFENQELIIRNKKLLMFLNNLLDDNFNKTKNKQSSLLNMNKWIDGILDKNK